MNFQYFNKKQQSRENNSNFEDKVNEDQVGVKTVFTPSTDDLFEEIEEIFTTEEEKEKMVEYDPEEFISHLSMTRRGMFITVLILIDFGLYLITGLPFFGIILIIASVLFAVDYYMFVKNPLEDLFIKRHVDRALMFEGDFSLVEVEITNRNPHRPIGILEVEEHYQPEITVLTTKEKVTKSMALGPRESDFLRYLFKIDHMGKYIIGPIKMTIKDFFGLFSVHVIAPIFDDVVIFPRIEEAQKMFQVAQRRKLGRFFDIFRLKEIGAGLDFFGLREYQRTDDHRTIDWKASAKRNMDPLMVRIYETTNPLNVLVAIDAGKSMMVKLPDGKTKYEKILPIAAFLILLALSTRDQVGLAIFDSEVTSFLKPTTSRRVFYDALRTFAMTDKGNKTSYRQLANYIVAGIRERTLIIIITDLEGDLDELHECIRILRLKKFPVLLLYLKNEELEFETSILSYEERLFLETYLAHRASDIIREARKKGVYTLPLNRKDFEELTFPVTLERWISVVSQVRR